MPVFKNKMSRFGSLISLIAVTAMLGIYSLALPEFLASSAGRLFAVVWAVLAIVIFVAHARRMAGGRRSGVQVHMMRNSRDRRQDQKDQRLSRLRG